MTVLGFTRANRQSPHAVRIYMRAKAYLTEKPELGPLVSPQGDQTLPIHNWYSYKHGYSSALAKYLIEECELSKGQWVLDPFCGGGTTILACKELGINAAGYDILPFSVFLSNVKLDEYDPEEIRFELESLKSANPKSASVNDLPDIPLVKKAFTPEVRANLLALKARIDGIGGLKARSLFTLAFLSIVESVSNTIKDGGFLRIVRRDIDPGSIEGLLIKKINLMLSDIVQAGSTRNDGKVSAIANIGDARRLPTNRVFDAVITSPPYPNRHDYTRIYSLEMIFDFVANNDELKKVRYDTIRSHVEARKKYEAPGYERPRKVDELTKDIDRNGTNNPQVLEMLRGYFEDMYLVLSEISRCLKDKGKAALVVSNVRFAGVNVPVDEILAELGQQVGLKLESVVVLRYRGNSSQQVREYKRTPSRESIILWENA